MKTDPQWQAVRENPPANWREEWANRNLLTRRDTMVQIEKWVLKHQKDYELPIKIGIHPKDGFVAYTEQPQKPATLQAYCPLCDETMEYKEVNGTHLWTCPECPAVLYEYRTIKDTENLNAYLEPHAPDCPAVDGFGCRCKE